VPDQRSHHETFNVNWQVTTDSYTRLLEGLCRGFLIVGLALSDVTLNSAGT